MGIRISPYQQRLRQAGLPGVRQSNVDVSSGLQSVGRGLMAATEGVSQYVDSMDSAALMDAAGKLEKLWGQRNSELVQHKQKDAGAYAPAALEQWQKDIDSVEAGLNERQRRAFVRIKTEKRNAWESHVRNYVASEGEQYKADAYNSLTGISAQNASLAAASNDMRRVGELVSMQQDAIALRGKEEGWSDARIASERLERLGAIHAGVISSMLEAKRTRDARDYLGAHRQDIPAGIASSFDSKFSADDIKERAVAVANEISLTLRADAPDKFSLDTTRAMELLYADPEMQKNPEVRSAAVNILLLEAQDAENARQLNDGEKFGRLIPQLRKTGTLDRQSDDYLSLSDKGRKELERRAVPSQSGSSKPSFAAANRAAQKRFAGMPIEEQLKVDPDTADFLSGAEDWVRDWVRENKKRLQRAWDHDHGMTSEQAKARVREAAGVARMSGKAKKDLEDAAAFMVSEWMKANPDAVYVPDDVVEKLAKQANADIVRDVWYGTKKEKGYQQIARQRREGGGGGSVTMPMPTTKPSDEPLDLAPLPTKVVLVPDRDRRAIVEVFKRRNGRDPTEEEILDWYTRK